MLVLSPNVPLVDPLIPGTNANSPLIGWHNVLAPSMLSADEEDPDHPVVNLANPATFLRWQGESTAAQEILATVGLVDEVDYVGFANHNFGSSQISVEIEGSSDGVDYSSLVGPAMLGTDGPALFRFEPGAFSHIRIKLGSGTEIPFCSTMYIGKLLVVPRKMYVGHTPLPYGRVTQVANGRSESGHFLGRIVTGEYRQSSAFFDFLEPDWYREHFEPFVKAAQEQPFFFAWRPGDYPEEVGFAWLTDDIRPVNSLPNGMMRVALDMQGVA